MEQWQWEEAGWQGWQGRVAVMRWGGMRWGHW